MQKLLYTITMQTMSLLQSCEGQTEEQLRQLPKDKLAEVLYESLKENAVLNHKLKLFETIRKYSTLRRKIEQGDAASFHILSVSQNIDTELQVLDAKENRLTRKKEVGELLNTLFATMEELEKLTIQDYAEAIDEGNQELSELLTVEALVVMEWLNTLSGLRENVLQSKEFVPETLPQSEENQSEPIQPRLPESVPQAIESAEPLKEFLDSPNQPVTFSFFGINYPFVDWDKLYRKVCETMILMEPYVMARLDSDVDIALPPAKDNLPPRVLFSDKEGKITKDPIRLSNGVWVESLRDEDEVICICYRIIQICGFSLDELLMQYE